MSCYNSDKSIILIEIIWLCLNSYQFSLNKHNSWSVAPLFGFLSWQLISLEYAKQTKSADRLPSPFENISGVESVDVIFIESQLVYRHSIAFPGSLSVAVLHAWGSKRIKMHRRSTERFTDCWSSRARDQTGPNLSCRTLSHSHCHRLTYSDFVLFLRSWADSDS